MQEFQFGLSWSDFARFYGDVFGPTLAIEGMLAFFLEATFLGLWWFGADRLRPALHLATIWIVAVGTLISAYVILAANAFMQNPVAYTLDPVTGRARLGDFTDLLTNEVVLAAFPHTIAGAFLGGGALLLAIGGFRRWRSAGGDATGQWRLLVRVGAWTTLVSGTAVALTGDLLGKVMTSVQPMKMAAAEALYATQAGAPFSLFAVGAPGDDGAVLHARRAVAALVPRDGRPDGHRPGHRRPAGPVRRAVRAGRLRPGRADGLLELPLHDRVRGGGDDRRGLGAVADAPGAGPLAR